MKKSKAYKATTIRERKNGQRINGRQNDGFGKNAPRWRVSRVARNAVEEYLYYKEVEHWRYHGLI